MKRFLRRNESRSIPAWAGEPLPQEPPIYCARVYPRVGGGTFSRMVRVLACVGLSPRGRGNRYLSVFKLLSLASVYPRVGGGTFINPHSDQGSTMRSIPAWAGEPVVRRVVTALETVYPRVGGGTLLN